MVLVIDCAATMQVVEDGKSRIDWARDRARELLNNQSPRELMIIAARSRPEVIAPFSADRNAWQRALADLRAIDSQSDLEGALSAALSAVSAETGKVYLLTDAQIPEGFFTTNQVRNLFVQQPPDENRDNLGIVNFNDGKVLTAQFPFFVEVRNYSNRARNFSLLLRNEAGDEISRSEMSIPAQEARRHFVSQEDRSQLTTLAGIFSLELDLERRTDH